MATKDPYEMTLRHKSPAGEIVHEDDEKAPGVVPRGPPTDRLDVRSDYHETALQQPLTPHISAS
jgi:hypothetical protein